MASRARLAHDLREFLALEYVTGIGAVDYHDVRRELIAQFNEMLLDGRKPYQVEMRPEDNESGVDGPQGGRPIPSSIACVVVALMLLIWLANA